MARIAWYAITCIGHVLVAVAVEARVRRLILVGGSNSRHLLLHVSAHGTISGGCYRCCCWCRLCRLLFYANILLQVFVLMIGWIIIMEFKINNFYPLFWLKVEQLDMELWNSVWIVIAFFHSWFVGVLNLLFGWTKIQFAEIGDNFLLDGIYLVTLERVVGGRNSLVCTNLHTACSGSCYSCIAWYMWGST